MALWDAVKEAAPELTLVAPHDAITNHPALRHWLLVQFALHVPTRWIKDDLASIRKEQVADGESVWPPMGKRQIDNSRLYLEPEWRPITNRIEQGIEKVGVLAKNQRLMALQQLYERLQDKVWNERNSRNDELYLIKELRAVLRQIAEEKGELGDDSQAATDVLGELAKMLVEKLSLQGSGIKETGEPNVGAYFAEDK